MITKFKIKARMSKKYIWVIVYPTLQAMRKAATYWDRTSENSGSRKMSHAKTYGISHHYTKERVHKTTGKIIHLNEIATIRLSKKHLSTEIVAHELIHAAMWNYRLDYGSEREYEGSSYNADFGNSCNADEEIFAHLYGQLFRSMNEKLHDTKLWGGGE